MIYVLRWINPEGIRFYLRDVRADGQPEWTADPARARRHSRRSAFAARRTLKTFADGTTRVTVVKRRL